MTRLCGHRILEILILTSLGSFLLLPRNEYIPVASAYIGFWPRNQVSKVSENKIQINEINLINISDDQLIKFPIQTISKVGTKRWRQLDLGLGFRAGADLILIPLPANLDQTFKSWKRERSTRKEIAGQERYDWRN